MIIININTHKGEHKTRLVCIYMYVYVSQPYGPPRFIIGITLLYMYIPTISSGTLGFQGTRVENGRLRVHTVSCRIFRICVRCRNHLVKV